MKDRPEPPLHPRRKPWHYALWWLLVIGGVYVAVYGGGLLMEWVREVIR